MDEAAGKGFLPKLSQFSHPDESIWEVRGQMTPLELVSPKRLFCCANELQRELQEGKAVPRKMWLWKNGTFQLLPNMFSMRRDLEAWNSSSSKESSFWDGSTLFGKVLAGTRTGSPQEQAQRVTFPWPDHHSVMPPWRCSTSLAGPLLWKRSIFPVLFHSPRNHPPCSPPPLLLHLSQGQIHPPACLLAVFLLHLSHLSVSSLPWCLQGVHLTYGAALPLSMMLLESSEVQSHPKTPGWDPCGSQGEFCLPDGILA